MWDQGRQIAPDLDRSLGNPGPLLTFFMLPRVTVDRALDIRRGLRPRNSPVFPSTWTMYLAVRRQRRWHHAQPRTPLLDHTPRRVVSQSLLNAARVCVQGLTQASSDPKCHLICLFW